MTDPVIAKGMEFLRRTSPGSGGKDDGHPGTVHVRMRSIHILSTERLQRRAAQLHHEVRTPEGLHAFDGPRRELIHRSLHLKCIEHELTLRGEA